MDEQIKKILDSYRVSSPLPEDQEQTLTILKEYLPGKKKNTLLRTFKNLLGIALQELLATSKLHYFIMIALILALFPFLDASIDPYLMLFFTAPIPLFIGFWNLSGRGHNVMKDLEKTFVFSYEQVLCSRIITITGISILFLMIPILYFLLSGFHMETFSIFRLVMYGVTPTFIFSVYLLYIATIRHENVLGVSVLVWGAMGFAAISTPIGDMILSIHLTAYVLLNVTLLILLIYMIARLLKNKGRSFENI
ncbi:hypothetical protein MKY41_04935 [Sporosarcina sp. FSL W7-1349]|uniref:hypothetical protein n=1 Tax=Sporosarcina sp. FSL W7-1349 TaxID=2921561 RepID=UPI0030FD0C74